MDITLDITDYFNSVVNYSMFFDWDYSLMNPILFFTKPFQFTENFCFELMNFGLNIEKDMENLFHEKRPYFDDILRDTTTPCYMCKSILIFGKAKFEFSKLKGLCVQLRDPSTPPYKEVYDALSKTTIIVPSDGLYYEHQCKLKTGDNLFDCGGKSEFSNHNISIRLIAEKGTTARITFSSNDYVLMTGHNEADEKNYAKMQTAYNWLNCESREDIWDMLTTEKPKMLDVDYYNRYIREGQRHYASCVAYCDEE